MKKIIALKFLTLLIAPIVASADVVESLADKLRAMPELSEAITTLNAHNKLDAKVKSLEVTAPKEDRLWVLKTLASGSYLLYTISTENNPFRPCYKAKYDLVSGFIRGSGRDEHQIQRKAVEVQECIKSGVASLVDKHGENAFQKTRLTKEEKDLANKVIGISMVVASEGGAKKS